MPEDIHDFLKPKSRYDENGKEICKFNQGTFHPLNEAKCIGDVNKLYFRSGWEFDWFKWMDKSPSVIRYAAESVQVPYMHPIDKKERRYYIDVYMELRAGDGEIIKWLIEIKPHKYTVFPMMPKKKTKKAMENYVRDYNITLVNIAKFKAAKYYAKQFGCMFGVVSKDKLTGKFSLVEWSEDQIKVNTKRE